MVVVEQIKLPVGHTKEDVSAQVCKRLGIKDTGKCPAYEMIRRSIDARKKPDIFFVYSVMISEPGFRIPKKADKRYVKEAEQERYRWVGEDICGADRIHKISADDHMAEGGDSAHRSGFLPDSDSTDPVGHKGVAVHDSLCRPVVVGFGPAGMFCALFLARAGLRPVVMERGKPADERIKDVEDFFAGGTLKENSNVQFGEGGAGTFSDGKLNTGVGAQGGRSREVLVTFARHGAPEEILYDNKPHIGTDVLVNVVKSIREEIIFLGGEVLFDSRLTDIKLSPDGSVASVIYRSTEMGDENEIRTDALCLAIGHSARDTFAMLYEKGVPMQQKAFAVGLRIEHPQSLIDRFMYGDDHEELRRKYGLPAADYKLTAHTGSGRGVYSFCMCPGGFVVNSSSEQGMTAVNGMSYHARDGANANSALIVTVSGEDFGRGVLDGVEFQRRLERAAYAEGAGKVPVQLLGDFLENKKSTGLGTVNPCIKGGYDLGNLREVLPTFVSDAIAECMPAFEKRIPGFSMGDACLSGVESRTSSPVRILRGGDRMSDIRGLFPCGEGAGYAGGIMSSAVDGIKAAEDIFRFKQQ